MPSVFQSERSFQKQPTVFLAKKKAVNSKTKNRPTRHVRNIGLGFRVPIEVGGGCLHN